MWRKVNAEHNQVMVAVSASDVCVRRLDCNILNGVNIRVPHSAIYCLIGPSGCGKTTLLRCIAGVLSPSSGHIRVFGQSPGQRGLQIPGPRVGYMPQEVALYADLTVTELVHYFGAVNLCEPKQLSANCQFLLSLLLMSDEKHSLIGSLSGGQKRRVSFIVSVAHSPPLLLMDEPTAGMDPLLRHNIWQYLKVLTETQTTTVIITTHYIEEARNGATVAMMRDGRVLCEQSPAQLLRSTDATSLEQAFYRVCTQRVPHVCAEARASELERRVEPIETNLSSYVRVLSAVVRKNWTRNRRHFDLMLFQFFMPVVIVCVFCVGIGAHPFHIGVAVVNEDSGRLSSNFLAEIDAYFVHLYHYSSAENALRAVKAGHVWAALHIGHNFSEALHHRLVFDAFTDESAENASLASSVIRVYADLTNKVISVTILRTLREAFVRFAQRSLRDEGYNWRMATPPVVVETALYGSDDKHRGYTQYMVPGLLVNISFVMSAGLTALVFVLERKEGTFERQSVAGVRASQIVVAHAIVRIATMLLQTAIVLTIVLNWLQWPTRASVVWMFALISLQNCSGLAFGLAVSALVREESTAAMFIAATVMWNMAMCGMIWPIEAIPHSVRWLSYATLTLPTEALRSLMNRAWSVDHPRVYYGFAASIAWLCIFSIIAVKFLRIKN